MAVVVDDEGRPVCYEILLGNTDEITTLIPLVDRLHEDRRYMVCHNEEQARENRTDREAILEKLGEQLKQGSMSLVGNKGFHYYLFAPTGSMFQIDQAKVKRDARFDGKWVLRTDTDLPAEHVALRYKDLLMVEDAFRTVKSILDTRPIFHKCVDTIRGHVFCSFLALVLLNELQDRMHSQSWAAEWQRLRDDLDELQDLTLPLGEKTFVIRTPPVHFAGQAIQTVAAALGPSVSRLDCTRTRNSRVVPKPCARDVSSDSAQSPKIQLLKMCRRLLPRVLRGSSWEAKWNCSLLREGESVRKHVGAKGNSLQVKGLSSIWTTAQSRRVPQANGSLIFRGHPVD